MKNTIGQPGALTQEQLLQQIIRVNHAGEYGAKRIYQGQMKILEKSDCYETIKHMAEQEDEHLRYFSQQINARKVRPTALIPLWHAAGYVMGAVTALLGKKAAMACTVAVEEVIDQHYQEQLELLGDNEAQLKEKIEKFRQEELEHRDIGIKNNAEKTVVYPLLYSAVKNATKFAIFLSKRI